MVQDGARTWLLTGSSENYAASSAHGFSVIGCKERMYAAAGVGA